MTGHNIPPSQTSLKPEQIEELKGLFRSFDRNHDGTVSREELYNVLTSMGMRPGSEQLDAMLPNGQAATFEKFCTIMLPTFNDQGADRTIDQELAEAFRAFDKDGNGFISASELKSMMRSLGDSVSDDDVRKIIADVDVNGDGVVSYEEFITMMKPSNNSSTRNIEIKRKKDKNRKSLLNVKGWFHKSKRET